MRTLVAMGLLWTAVMLAGCQITPPSDPGFSSTFFTNFADVASWENRDRPPYVLSYPDDTMFFYRIWEYHPRADLNLRAISCAQTRDGALVVRARVQNMGADVVPTIPNFNGDLASFRIAALVTWNNGTQQEVDAMVPFPMAVTGTVEMQLTPTRYFAKDVTRIDVVADPDRIVPDPIRLNNVLSWEGTMSADEPHCDVVRS